MPFRSRPTLALVAGLLIGIALSVAGRVLADRAPQLLDSSIRPGVADPIAGLPWRDARLLAQVLQRIRDNYVDPVDDHQLMLNAIRGMVQGLDDHSTFMSPDQFEDMQVNTSGAYAGIGVEVAPSTQGVSVIRRMSDSPAERAGIRTGDIIVRIDDVAVDPRDVNAAIERMRGPNGSTIRLAVRRAGAPALIEFKIDRAPVMLRSVSAQLLTPNYGYLRITSFTDTTANELEQAVDHLEHTPHGRLKGLVIDLRNNPGGVLDAAVQIADDFLDHGTIVSAIGRATDANFRMDAKPGDITHGAQLVLLVNGGSASASEILAAALHDNGRAMLVGRRTYGKGSVQTIMPLSDGQAVKMTTSRYFTPSGISINGVGIVPDVVLAGPEAPPAELDASDDTTAEGSGGTLLQRDAQVALALQQIGPHDHLIAQHATASTASVQ
jgi:carboxyl-terminal processing protease